MTRRYCYALVLATGTMLVSAMSAQSAARVQHVAVFGSGSAVEVEIQSSGAVVPQAQMITGPDRIVVDFPGTLPAAELRNMNVGRGAVKGIRTGLFSTKPPVTRVVLDLSEPQAYQVFSVRNVVMIKIGPRQGSAPRIADAALTTTSSSSSSSSSTETTPVTPPKPPVEITFENGLLKIHTERAASSRSYFEKNAAEFATSQGRLVGLEQYLPNLKELLDVAGLPRKSRVLEVGPGEEIAVELGPAPAREVLAALLNGSRYNFIFVGNSRGRTLQKAILSVR